MRALLSLLLIGCASGIALVVAESPAIASTISEPSERPILVTVDKSGTPQAFTVKAAGFKPYQSVFIEQCNGREPTAEHWQPTIDCDLGSSPAAAIAGSDGVAVFLAADKNHAFHPFSGSSTQQLFNCLVPHAAPPKNGMPNFRNCQLRVSTNNTASTADQTFASFRFADGSSSSASSSTPRGALIAAAFTAAFAAVGGVIVVIRRRRGRVSA